jgi:hypothetical protein
MLPGVKSKAESDYEAYQREEKSTAEKWTIKAFIAANRPRLRMRGVHVLDEEALFPTWLYVANIGGSNATNIRVHAVFTLKRGNNRVEPWIDNLDKSVWHSPAVVLAPDEEATYELHSKPDIVDKTFFIAMAEQITSIIGTVRYKDANGTERKTGFGWAYDLSTREFTKPEKEDKYNYED